MSTDAKPETQKQSDAQTQEIECPHCKHKFLHKVKEKLAEAGESLGNAIGDAMENR
jgi:DNA-directed RNA polymerase subunit RPC12/RpoP